MTCEYGSFVCQILSQKALDCPINKLNCPVNKPSCAQIPRISRILIKYSLTRKARLTPMLQSLTTNRHAQFWLLQTAGWSGWVLLFALRDLYWSQPLERISLLIIDAFAGFVLTTVLRYLYRGIWDRPVIFRVIVVLAASYIVAGIWQPIKNYSQFTYYSDFSAIEEYGDLAYFHGIIGYSYFLILCWSGLYFGLKFYRLLQVQIQRSIKAESMAHEAQLRMLRYQLNPHFLFNTLNAISTLVLEENTRVANEMVSKLSNFLRYSLDNDPMQKVDLAHEINTMKLYLEIEQVRFDERLQVEFNIEDDAASAMVPSLLLQPLVENAIKFAVSASEEGGKITVNAKVCAGDLLIEVIDNGPGMDGVPVRNAGTGGVGLQNTRERLEAMYGNAQAVKFSHALPRGLKIDICMPFELDKVPSTTSTARDLSVSR
jgi:two-component system LytT family sensor kinase